eukprot:3168909-Prymnesium_polylepis.1
MVNRRFCATPDTRGTDIWTCVQQSAVRAPSRPTRPRPHVSNAQEQFSRLRNLNVGFVVLEP